MRNTLLIPLLICLLTYSSTFGQYLALEEVSFKHGALTLYADIFSPQDPAGKTGIALIQGSGDSDRTNLWSRAFAEMLAENGYYVLLPDKRGCGKSEGDWKNASFQDLAGDAIASVSFFKEKLHLEKVGIMGLSQGGSVAPIAAGRDPDITFVIAVSSAAVTLEEQIIHEMSNTARKEGLNPNEIKEMLDLHILLKEYALNRDWAPLEKRYTELRSSGWSEFAGSFPHSPDSWLWDWVQLNIGFNAMDYWPKLQQDVFIAYGSKDQDDNVPVYQSIYRLQKGFHAHGKENFTLEVYEAGHAIYEDEKAVLRQEFVKGLLDWIAKR